MIRTCVGAIGGEWLFGIEVEAGTGWGWAWIGLDSEAGLRI